MECRPAAPAAGRMQSSSRPTTMGTPTSDSTAQVAAAKQGPASNSGSAAAQPRPLNLPFGAAHALVHACCLLQMLSLLAASWTAAQPNRSNTFGYLLLSAFEVVNVGFTLDNMHGVMTKRFTESQLLDRSLIFMGGLIPTFQILLTLVHPPFLAAAAEKNWAAFAAFLMGLGVPVGRLPPAHGLVLWLLSFPCFTALDCYGRRSQEQQQCPTGTWSSYAACHLSRGALIGAAGLAAWVTAYVLVIKHSERLQSQAESMVPQDQAPSEGNASGTLPGQPPSQQSHVPASRQSEAPTDTPSVSSSAGRVPLPFESWGLQLPPAAARFCHWLDRSMTRMAEAVNEELLVKVVCLPIMFYSMGFCLLARMKLQGLTFCDMSPDTFLIYMMAWFIVGRNSWNFDIGLLAQRIQAVASAAFARASHQPSLLELVDRLRQHVAGGARHGSTSGNGSAGHDITVTELLGEGAFGKVYKGVWRGTTVAVKRMLLPADLKNSERRERMAIMEAAISGALVHPNIVQTYTYTMQSVPGGSAGGSQVQGGGTPEHVPGRGAPAGRRTLSAGGATTPTTSEALEIQLVLQYMDCGTLRDVLDDGCFEAATSPGGRPAVNYYAVLETAADVAKGMMHLHSLNVIHCDLKARNVLLRSCASDPRSFTAKVGDFGLSLKLDSGQASVDNCFNGTATHMAPEVHTLGRQSKAADVFSFGITMWELYTGRRPFQGLSRALLHLHIAEQDGRPHFPSKTPRPYAALAARCWHRDPDARPSFEEVVDRLVELVASEGGDTVPVPVTVLGAQVTVFRPVRDAQDAPPQPPQPQAAPTAVGDSLPPAAGAEARGVADETQPERGQRIKLPAGTFSCVSPGCILPQHATQHEPNPTLSAPHEPEAADPLAGSNLTPGVVRLADASGAVGARGKSSFRYWRRACTLASSCSREVQPAGPGPQAG